ncbi:SC6A7 protein, partial [Columbina picui]|nr:SC6A7 protein [Columbina picui]
GAFLVPYFIMLAICGIPIFFMELSLGQFSSLGPLAVWKISPLFKGVGMGTILIVSLVAIYYNMIIAYVLFYLFASLTSDLPWQHCGNWWNTDLCLDHHIIKAGNATFPINITNTVSPSEEYWSNLSLLHTLSILLFPPGPVLCLCFWMSIEGMASSPHPLGTGTMGRISPAPVTGWEVVMAPSSLGGCFQTSALFRPIFFPQVWIEAALQIFYSLGVGFGGLLTFASYNTFHQNIYRDTFIVTLGNAITSILAGFAIFSVLGYMSQELGVPVNQVAKAGPGLAFVVYPQAMTMLPLSPFWSFLFFFMLLTLGLDSQFAFMETIVTAVTDEFPYYLRPKKASFSAVICIALFLMGLILTTEGGMYWLVLLDDYSAGFGLMVVVITTCLVVTRVYGMKRFCRDIHMMLGFKPGPYFRACWMVLSPATMMASVRLDLLGGAGEPQWCQYPWVTAQCDKSLCWHLLPQRLLWFCWERVQQASRPAMDWGPSLEENRTGMYVASLAGSQSPKPLMVHMRKYGGITSYENTAIEVDREMEEDEEEESMM